MAAAIITAAGDLALRDLVARDGQATELGVRLCRAWAAERGYRGDSGGWIRTASGRALAHGWAGLAARHATLVLAWARRQYLLA